VEGIPVPGPEAGSLEEVGKHQLKIYNVSEPGTVDLCPSSENTYEELLEERIQEEERIQL